ncbi:DNA-directed RNA polymerase III subunit RPC4 isoform X2 [Hemicordylus capensis]|uniref:DNA-directed RNA polymerase III subunit RPC4 isoform X2 n=1 Tax=Hemicordylus capensis TaxID=884348 RepID=UPI0023037169|nr:DNA-directed RNA polymerase III subunit RPC4 isoform X2 [Hemicordylus capensis]
MSDRSSGNDPGNSSGIRPTLTAARGLIGRRTTAPITPGRLPSIRSRDLTLGGVKKKTFAPNIISRKIKEEPKEDVSVKEKKERDRDRQRDSHGRGRGRPEVIQSHSIFEQGPAEMMKKKGTWDKTVDMSDFGPSHIINIKKEKRETDEETKQILRMLEKDDFLDDPGLKNDIRNKPVQLPLAHSGWLFKEDGDEQEDTKPLSSSTKEEEMEVDVSSVKVKEEPHDEEEPLPALQPAHAKAPPPFPQDLSVAELLQRLSLCKEDELLFLQLPDTLPGQPPTQDTKPIKAEVQTEDGQVMMIKQEKNQEAKEAENICTLGDLSEGQVGKLLIRKSGKVQLVLGRVTLDMTTGTPCSFLQGRIWIKHWIWGLACSFGPRKVK